jgi:hypothetical protein
MRSVETDVVTLLFCSRFILLNFFLQIFSTALERSRSFSVFFHTLSSFVLDYLGHSVTSNTKSILFSLSMIFAAKNNPSEYLIILQTNKGITNLYRLLTDL